MNCEVLAVGSEITLGLSLDSNSSYIASQLGKIGIVTERISSVPDDVEIISSVIDETLNRVNILLITGGLGPTVDDLTREAIVKFAKTKLLLDEDLANLIKKRYSDFDSPMTEIVLRQAYLPPGAIPIAPSLGTAPGLIVEVGERVIFALPGVPTEMKEMLHRGIIPYLKKRFSCNEIIDVAIFKVCGLSEAEIQKKIRKILKDKRLTIVLLSSLGEVSIQIVVKGKPDSAKKILLEVGKEVRKELGNNVFGMNGDILEKVVGNLLTKRHLTLSIAESCTGGLLSNRITNVPGSSDYFLGGLISYSNDIKESILSVPRKILSNYGAVSSQTAEAMASGIAQVYKSDISLAITGIAGPSGGSDNKPVGTVYIALWLGGYTYCKKFCFPGLREEIKWRATQKSLEIIRLFLLEKLRMS